MGTPTYNPIQTVTLGSPAASVTFSSIPATYTDLILVINAVTTANTKNPVIRFNGDSGTNYSDTHLVGNGTSATSDRDANVNAIYMGVVGIAGGNESAIICNIMNYANASINKAILARTSSAFNSVYLTAGLWRSTAAINQIDITTLSAGQNWAIGSKFAIFGIKAA